MTPQLAYEYIRRRMDALGYSDYQIRLRHFVLAPLEVRTINAGLHLFLLVNPVDAIRIESDGGLFDLTETKTNELQYEHTGTMRLTNYSSSTAHLPMIEVLYKTL